MKEDLAIKQLYDDFIIKVTLTDNEKDILDRYIRGDTYVNMSMETKQSYSNVSRTINDLKNKYELYKQLELIKLNLLQRKKWDKHGSLSLFYFATIILKGEILMLF